ASAGAVDGLIGVAVRPFAALPADLAGDRNVRPRDATLFGAILGDVPRVRGLAVLRGVADERFALMRVGIANEAGGAIGAVSALAKALFGAASPRTAQGCNHLGVCLRVAVGGAYGSLRALRPFRALGVIPLVGAVARDRLRLSQGAAHAA